MSDIESENARLRGWLQFYAEFYRYSLHGIASSAETALRGESAPGIRPSASTSETQAQYALRGVDGFLCDLFGSDWHKDIKRHDCVVAMRKHLGI